MTLAWQSTSQKNFQTRFPTGLREKSVSFFDPHTFRAIGRSRHANTASDATIAVASNTFSTAGNAPGSARCIPTSSSFNATAITPASAPLGEANNSRPASPLAVITAKQNGEPQPAVRFTQKNLSS